MHIILVSDRLATAKSISLGTRHLLLGVALLAATVVALSSSMFYLVFRHAAEIKLPLVQQLLLSAQEQQAQNAKEFVRENLNAIAVRVGQMQAQLVRLDALGERLSALAGIKPQEFRMNEPPARGGALSTSIPAQDLSMNELSDRLDVLSKHLDNRYDYLGILENRLFDARGEKDADADRRAGCDGLERIQFRLAHRSVYRTERHARGHRLYGRQRHAYPRCCRRRSGRRPIPSAIRQHDRYRPWQRLYHPLRACFQAAGQGRATWCSAVRSSPCPDPPDARPGRTCTSRCATRASRRIPTASCQASTTSVAKK